MSEQGNFNVTNKAFKLISNSTEILLEAYNTGFVDYNAIEDKKSLSRIDSLKESHLLFATNQGKMRLNPLLSRCIGLINEDEKSRYINTDFEGQFEELKILTDRYLKINHTGRLEANRVFSDIETIAYEIMESITTSSQRLRLRINTQFGYVKTIEDKKVENERAIVIAERLIRNIKVFNFAQLSRLSGTNIKLRHLLGGSLNDVVDLCYRELQVTLGKLRELLTTYRVQQKTSLLVINFLKYFALHPDYLPHDYTEEAVIPSLLNVAAPLELHSNLDISNESLEDQIINIINSTKVKHAIESPQKQRKAGSVINACDKPLMQEVDVDVLSVACSRFIVKVISTKKQLSASTFFNEEALSCSENVWLFVLASTLEDLSDSYKKKIGHKLIVDSPQGIIGAGKRMLRDIECFFKI